MSPQMSPSDERHTVPDGFKPSAPGRGPARLGRWYEIITTDGETIVARYTGFNASDQDRAKHILSFEGEGFGYDLPYGEILSCLPMHAQYRAAEIRRRQERDDRRRERRHSRR